MGYAEKEQLRGKLRGKKLLIIDDNRAQLKNYAEQMRACGFEVIPWLIVDKDRMLKMMGGSSSLDSGKNPMDSVDEFLRELHPGMDIVAVPDELRTRLKSTAFDALLTDLEIQPDRAPEDAFTGMDVIREVAALKPGLPMILHSGKYETEGNRHGRQARDAMLKEDSEKVVAMGGIGAFEKNTHCGWFGEVFAEAFAARAKQV